MLEDYYRQYGLLLIYSGVAVALPASMLLISWLGSLFRIRPRRPSPLKYDIYECGMETVGGRWLQFNFRYYLYALLFVLFDVEAVFLYPWAIQFHRLGAFALVEMFLFILVLVVGWLYAWRKQALEWR